MHKVLMVLRREYIAQVRTKMFWIGTLAIPAGMIGLMAILVVLTLTAQDTVRRIGVVDETGKLFADFETALERHQVDGAPKYPLERIDAGEDASAAVDALKPRVLSDELHAILWIGSDLNGKDNFQIFRRSVGDEAVVDDLRDEQRDLVIGLRLAERDLQIEREVLDELTASVRLSSFQVGEFGCLTDMVGKCAQRHSFFGLSTRHDNICLRARDAQRVA